MKALKTFRNSCFLLALSLVSFPVLSGSVHLVDAIEKGLVKATFLNLGGSSDECVELELTNLQQSELAILIQSGTMITPTNQAYQDLVIISDDVLVLEPNTPVQRRLKAYCTEPYDATPIAGELYSLKTSNYPEGLQELIAELQGQVSDEEVWQTAIWNITDEFPLAGVDGEAEEQAQQAREILSEMTGVENPWYTVDYGDVLDSPWTNEPQSLSGVLVSHVTESGLGKLFVLDPDGEILYLIYENEPMVEATYTQTFNFSATSMKRGEYRFVLEIDGEKSAEQLLTL